MHNARQERGNNNGIRNEEVGTGEPVIPPNFQGLPEFRKTKPPSFYGEYDPLKAQRWINQLDKIFVAMGCTDAQRVTFATYMLEGEAEFGSLWNSHNLGSYVA